MTHSFPPGYSPLAFCRSCGKDFSGDRMFTTHRVGVHDYTYAEGLRRNPPVEDGRRCMDADEMRELGWRPMTDEEMRSSRRDKHRAGFGIELWFDPQRHADARERIIETPVSAAGSDAKATRAAR